ncbi:hypothetical protein [Catellatospora tritici]|uniref:hypothetical protein n=1 Tax=Catellatospora tritici TaxID=2851566 RepID=UPI001C2D1DEE|nr:hypothetical protein [Catellatospora tritici]MBV1849439.1 hypothetical protein [Catellatospora tritici]MBV1854011.1 hypothetical protein [Catellatospora tritici]
MINREPRWLDRYQNGQHDQVWYEFRQLGGTIRSHPELLDEAQLVCDEMARRARHNIELIVRRLTDEGYRFHGNDDQETPCVAHHPPTPAADEHARWLERRFGAVPLTLLSWVRLVGDVWLVGTHPEWTSSADADPLVLEVEGTRHSDESIREYFDDAWSARRDSRLFVLPLAPDKFHKQNVSGGSPYGIVLPDGCVEGLFSWETTMPFVAYLNWVFGEGGFPLPSGDRDQWRVRHRLVKDMLRL